MTVDGWSEAIVNAVMRALEGNYTLVGGLAQQLAEEDEAKQLLRDAGFGCTGVSLLLTVREVVDHLHGMDVDFR